VRAQGRSKHSGATIVLRWVGFSAFEQHVHQLPLLSIPLTLDLVPSSVTFPSSISNRCHYHQYASLNGSCSSCGCCKHKGYGVKSVYYCVTTLNVIYFSVAAGFIAVSHMSAPRLHSCTFYTLRPCTAEPTSSDTCPISRQAEPLRSKGSAP
jgi:hypothetical protein